MTTVTHWMNGQLVEEEEEEIVAGDSVEEEEDEEDEEGDDDEDAVRVQASPLEQWKISTWLHPAVVSSSIPVYHIYKYGVHLTVDSVLLKECHRF